MCSLEALFYLNDMPIHLDLKDRASKNISELNCSLQWLFLRSPSHRKWDQLQVSLKRRWHTDTNRSCSSTKQQAGKLLQLQSDRFILLKSETRKQIWRGTWPEMSVCNCVCVCVTETKWQGWTENTTHCSTGVFLTGSCMCVSVCHADRSDVSTGLYQSHEQHVQVAW